MTSRGRAPRRAALESARALARIRGAFVGATSGALAVAAHGWAGGMLPSQSSLAIVVLVCAAIGTLAGRGERRGPILSAGILLAGQLTAHVALAVSAEHAHAILPTTKMSAAHLVAAVVCALAIGAAERGLTQAAATMRMAVVVPVDGVPVDKPAATPIPRTTVTPTVRLSVAAGLGMRAPPVH